MFTRSASILVLVLLLIAKVLVLRAAVLDSVLVLPLLVLTRSLMIIFVYYDCSQTAQSYSTNIRHAGRETTVAMQGSTINRRAKLLPHYGAQRLINHTGLTS